MTFDANKNAKKVNKHAKESTRRTKDAVLILFPSVERHLLIQSSKKNLKAHCLLIRL